MYFPNLKRFGTRLPSIRKVSMEICLCDNWSKIKKLRKMFGALWLFQTILYAYAVGYV